MSRELWAVIKCLHNKPDECGRVVCFENHFHSHKTGCFCLGGTQETIDFDAIWDRYVLVDGRNQERLTEDELRKVIFGGDEE